MNELQALHYHSTRRAQVRHANHRARSDDQGLKLQDTSLGSSLESLTYHGMTERHSHTTGIQQKPFAATGSRATVKLVMINLWPVKYHAQLSCAQRVGQHVRKQQLEYGMCVCHPRT